ncbi:unnamed protein product [Pleuronectes platessa]|uniref:Uncharacterized protein n=1 Tax=Pleuronectes platessa TaxID=8262 RepID=A0A9N7UL51_PLEPL|nr:unnamed protein product [Pleuronectes platessa]
MFIFVVKPLGTCRGWGSSRSVALLSAPPEAQCAAPGGPHPVAPHGVTGGGAFFLLDRGTVSIAGAEGGPLEGTLCSRGGVGHPAEKVLVLWVANMTILVQCLYTARFGALMDDSAHFVLG